MNNKLKNVKSFAVYYGYNNEDYLKSFDLLVLEPKGHTKEGIMALKKIGKKVVAYISISEIEVSDSDFILLDDDDLFEINGEKLYNSNYKTFQMDIRKEKVKNILLHRAYKLIEDGYDGFFLDTIGNFEYYNIYQGIFDEFLNSATQFVSDIRKNFENALIIQNNGLLHLCDNTAKYIDGLCFENPPYKTHKNKAWSNSIFDKLNLLNKNYNINILILEEENKKNSFILRCNSDKIKRIANKNEFLYYKAPLYYL